MCSGDSFVVAIMFLKTCGISMQNIKNTKEKLSFDRADMHLELRSPMFDEKYVYICIS